MRRFPFIAVAGLASVLLGLTSTGSAVADVDPLSPDSLVQDEIRRLREGAEPNAVEATPATITSSGAAQSGTRALTEAGSVHVKCGGKAPVNSPHYSSGAGGVIAKIRIACTGTGAKVVNLRVRGLLRFGASSTDTYVPPSSTWVTRATSDETRLVKVNGVEQTFYLPPAGSSGGRGTGWWIATGTWQFTISDGTQSSPGSATKTRWGAF